ncbi:TonB-dependent receptor [Moheibacter sediminis]|uniref:Iron complex outermembrane recepter protein n=1 Tax=Moheibacter sediminis TaxID=1434700 RepID=A0A1W1ZMH7_9FLAO|nr:TonB-dependent receptor plug domain-containing protein [Moheibacter sediminis]SMC49567.1 iron complex outermembrane recepter protein [Moheibacter sediminis]
MKSRIFLCAVFSGILAFGQVDEIQDSTTIELEGAEIIQRLPVTSEKISQKQIQKRNLGQDIPTLLGNATSVVTTSDAGAGIGYSSVRIRGIAQDHINITLNGVTMNDGESQGVFWVNMPDLASSTNSITIQRGVGTSTSGTGAFGAIINIDTSEPSRNAFLESANSWGSFNTQKYSLQGGTGKILNGKLRIDLNASLIKSDGYIDRAASDLYSYGMNAKYNLNENTSFRYWTFFGKEKTYQAWNGIDAETMKTNRTFNSSGAIYDADGNIVDYYNNETDNYQQHHNHFIWEQHYGNGWNSNATLYYMRGKGYYENYKQGETLSDFGIESEIDSDLVRQKHLDNHFYGLNFNLENQQLGNLKLFTGVSASQFVNDHFGKVIWVKDFENQNTNFEFYRNETTKNDVSAYAKALYKVNNFEFFGDLQYRFVDYKAELVPGGESGEEDFRPLYDNFNFINPKAGFNYFASKQDVLYFFYGMTHREPKRSDYMDNPDFTVQGIHPNPEKLHDFELGYKKSGRLNLTANAFYMYYINQLVATGELNDVGEYMRKNAGESYRAGIELSANYGLIPQKLSIFGNLTWSKNKILNHQEIEYDEDWNPSIVDYGTTNISFSPDWIGSLGVEFAPIKSLSLNVINKFVGEQFLTNTELEDGKLESYFLTDVLIRYAPNWFNVKNLEFSLLINNVFDVEYESNGFYYEGPYYYPQAGINVLGGFRIRL